MIISGGRSFKWEGLTIELIPCDLKEKNKDWLNANIAYDNISASLLICGYTVVSQWVKGLSYFLDSEFEKNVILELSSVLAIDISRKADKSYFVKVDLSEDPLLEENSWELECSNNAMEQLLTECKLLAQEYRKMIGEV